MAEARPDRVEIGFDGGQVIAVRLTEAQLADLRKALGHADDWHDVSTEDGDLALDLKKVVFLRTQSAEHRIGFSGS
jgi:hypothetical protein